jgi:hypothetical protein
MVSEGLIQSLCIVLNAPLFDDTLSFSKDLEDLAGQKFVPELAVQGFAVTVLPG